MLNVRVFMAWLAGLNNSLRQYLRLAKGEGEERERSAAGSAGQRRLHATELCVWYMEISHRALKQSQNAQETFRQLPQANCCPSG